MENGQPSCLATATTVHANLVAAAADLWLANQDQAVWCIRRIFKANEVDDENLLNDIGLKCMEFILSEWAKGNEIRNPRAMINRITVNACNDVLREWQRRPPPSLLPEDTHRLEQIFAEVMPRQYPDLEAEVLNLELLNELQNGLQMLKNVDRGAFTVFVLFILKEQRVSEVQQVLGRSRSWVYVKLDVGKGFMQRWMANYLELER